MTKIYIRKVNANEIGIRKGGKSKRAGSFLMVSKKCLDFFPELDPLIVNDSRQIMIISPNGRDTHVVEYVYHNQKLFDDIDGTRNEYRLYMSRELDCDSYLEPGDIVLMKKTIHKNIEGIKLFLFKPQSDSEYSKLNQILENSTHLLVDKVDIQFVDNYDFKSEIISSSSFSLDLNLKKQEYNLEVGENDTIAPSASAMIENLRSLGYTPEEAIADIVDNSISANAKNIWIQLVWSGVDSYILIEDDGLGMTEDELVLAMRPGSKDPKEERKSIDLGRFGMGMKSASFSLGKQLTVISRTISSCSAIRRWDLDYVASRNKWQVFRTRKENSKLEKYELSSAGTAVIIEQLDRLLTLNGGGQIITDREFYKLAMKIESHLALVFHRFLDNEKITIYLNGKQERNKVNGFNPHFKSDEGEMLQSDILVDSAMVEAKVRCFVTPKFEMLPQSIKRRVQQSYGFTQLQGVYIYRGDRLITYGGWLKLGKRNLMKINDDFCLGRVIVELRNDGDSSWRLDIKKTAATPPLSFRPILERAAEIARKSSAKEIVKRTISSDKNGSDGFWSKKDNSIKIDKNHSTYRILASDDEIGEAFINYIKNLEKNIPF